NFLYQDAYTTNPKIYSRTKLANARFTQMIQGQSDRKKTPLDGITVFSGGDERSETQKWLVDFGRWFLTVPTKFSTTVALDTLGVQPWKNMVRRTRTMFERESEFIPDLTYDDATELARYRGDLIVPAKLIDQLNFTGRKGAMWHFCDQLQQYLTTRNVAGEPKVTVIGHSMGAIVTCEMLERFHRLPVDNVVLMAAACSINDFKVKIIPYLEEQNLRADFASRAPAVAAAYGPFIKTKLYNLCLNDTGEHLEPNPGQLDLVQRGSLLTWVDTLYQNPESENDRTLGRWVNAVLATDDIPSGVLNRITIKGFGLDRRRRKDSPVYTADPSQTKVIDEPTKHGEFSRYQEKKSKRASNFRFWDPKFREPEPTADVAPR
ncbi:MAG: esterase/lipase family protein, partial [Chthoniobacterales bacterium]